MPELIAVGIDGTAKRAIGPAEVQSERRIIGLALLQGKGRSQREEGQSSEELHCDSICFDCDGIIGFQMMPVESYICTSTGS